MEDVQADREKNQHSYTDVPCMILAGGSARRFGTPKGLAELAGKPLLQHIRDILGRQTRSVIAINAASTGPYAANGPVCVPDVLTGGLGPLAGIHAAMVWAKARGDSSVITVPVDTPFLPETLVADFVKAGAPAVARSQGRDHAVCGIWPVGLLADLERSLLSGERSALGWVDRVAAQRVAYDRMNGVDPFFNINTLEDLHAAEALIGVTR